MGQTQQAMGSSPLAKPLAGPGQVPMGMDPAQQQNMQQLLSQMGGQGFPAPMQGRGPGGPMQAMQGGMQGQVYRGPLDTSGRPMQAPGTRQDIGGGVSRFTPQGGWGAGLGGAQTPQSSTGMQTPQLANQLGAIRGMQRTPPPGAPGAGPGMQRMPPPGAPGAGPGGAKGAAPGQQQMRQQIGQLPGAPPPGAPGRGPGQAKGNPAQNQLINQQVAQLPR
jgi:hypothetical protein